MQDFRDAQQEYFILSIHAGVCAVAGVGICGYRSGQYLFLFRWRESAHIEIAVQPLPQGTLFPGCVFILGTVLHAIHGIFRKKETAIVFDLQNSPPNRLRSVILVAVLLVGSKFQNIPDVPPCFRYPYGLGFCCLPAPGLSIDQKPQA